MLVARSPFCQDKGNAAVKQPPSLLGWMLLEKMGNWKQDS